MLRLTFDPSIEGLRVEKFKTKADWEAFITQFRHNPQRYNPQPQDMQPSKFPCIMLSCRDTVFNNPDGNDEYLNYFLYSATLEYLEE